MSGHLRTTWSELAASWRARWRLRDVAGEGGRIRGRPRLALNGTTTIGDRVRIDADVARVEIEVAPGATLSVGDDVHFEQGSAVGVTASVTIGDRCRIGRHVNVMDNGFHRLEPDRRLEHPPSVPIVIHDDVIIGPMTVVLPGAEIGEGSVIGPRSVVTGAIPARSYAEGAPATVTRST